MKVLKIEPKDRLTEYTHIEIQGITIPISGINEATLISRNLTLHTETKGIKGKIILYLENYEKALSYYEQVSELIKG